MDETVKKCGIDSFRRIVFPLAVWYQCRHNPLGTHFAFIEFCVKFSLSINRLHKHIRELSHTTRTWH